MDNSSPVAVPRATAPLQEERRWYFVDEAIHITARAECPPYTPPMQLPRESHHDYGPEPQHLRKLRAAARAGRVPLLDAARAPLSSLEDADIRAAVIEREELRRFALVELGIWLYRPMFADRATERRANGLFTLSEVAVTVAEQLRWQQSVQADFFDQAAAAAESRELPTYYEDTRLRISSGPVNRFGALAKRDDVDAWLAQRGAPYRPQWEALLQSDRETVESVNALSRLLPESYHTNFRPPENALTSGTAEQVAAEPAPETDEARPTKDYPELATRNQLISAFGAFTGIDKAWFKNLKDTPALLKARKVDGVGARGSTREPLFCPMEVMLWLKDPKRKKGRPFHSDSKPWELLKKNFPLAYAKHSRGDPRE